MNNDSMFNMDEPRNFSLLTSEGIEPFTAFRLPGGKIAFPKKAMIKINAGGATVIWDDDGTTWYEKGIKR